MKMSVSRIRRICERERALFRVCADGCEVRVGVCCGKGIERERLFGGHTYSITLIHCVSMLCMDMLYMLHNVYMHSLYIMYAHPCPHKTHTHTQTRFTTVMTNWTSSYNNLWFRGARLPARLYQRVCVYCILWGNSPAGLADGVWRGGECMMLVWM